MIQIGVIGLGKRSEMMLDLIPLFRKDVKVTAIADVDADKVKESQSGKPFMADNVKYFNDAGEMLDKMKFDGIFVGTRCSLHTKMALKVLNKNIPLFLEKPIATNYEDLFKLKEAAAKMNKRVVVSFPLRLTNHVQTVRKIIDSGAIGTVEHVQAWNNPEYGLVYYNTWYRDENETQGLFLQKATHDFDYLNYLLGIKPVYICAMKSKRVFKGNKQAGLKCDECGEQKTCMESPYNMFFTRWERGKVETCGFQCCFACDTGNEDSGSALIEYDTGMHVSYSQNFMSRKSAGIRGARFIGYKGTIEMEWYTNTIKVIMHHEPRVETHTLRESNIAHGGGDLYLMQNFIDVIEGNSESRSPLEAGLLSALMCMKAKESAEKREFKKIEWGR